METNWYIRKEFATIQSSKLWLSISCRNKSFGKKSLMGINLTDGCTLKLILIISMLEKLLSFRINFQNLTHLQFTGKDKVWLSSWRKYKDSTSDNLGHMIIPFRWCLNKKIVYSTERGIKTEPFSTFHGDLLYNCVLGANQSSVSGPLTKCSECFSVGVQRTTFCAERPTKLGTVIKEMLCLHV